MHVTDYIDFLGHNNARILHNSHWNSGIMLHHKTWNDILADTHDFMSFGEEIHANFPMA